MKSMKLKKVTYIDLDDILEKLPDSIGEWLSEEIKSHFGSIDSYGGSSFTSASVFLIELGDIIDSLEYVARKSKSSEVWNVIGLLKLYPTSVYVDIT